MSLISKIKRNNILGNIFSFGSATLLSAGLSFVVGVLTRNMLGPEQYGYWLTVSMLFSFVPLFQLGTVNAMNRDVPFYLARKDYNRVIEIKNLTLSFIFTLPLILVVLLFIISGLLFFIDISYEYQIGFLLASFISFFIFLSTYVEMYYKSEQNFRMASKLVSVKSILQSLVTILFVFIIGYEGLYIGMLLAFIIEVVMGSRSFQEFKFQFDLYKYKELIKTGFPILMVGLIWNILIASDRLIITIFMTPEDLGNYGVGMLIFSSMMLLPQVIGQVFYPKIVELVSKEKYDEIKRLYWKVNKLLSIMVGLIVVMGYFLFPIFINYFMPVYKEGIKAGQILILGIYPLTLVGFAANYLNATQNQRIYIFIQIITVIINFILSFILLYIQNNISSVAWGTSFSYFFYFILMNSYFLYKIKLNLGE
ncbi:oligosaccharide flippase family protein [Aeribacillus sp. FSL K6-1121]|uniref:lipopolysaccharide biosynthesis protein n=1 Tax=Aeribacillus TaxID=1055323 RepID=UPI002E1F998E|nr:oligosaccharide flippase family protein [Aeribacillus composti]